MRGLSSSSKTLWPEKRWRWWAAWGTHEEQDLVFGSKCLEVKGKVWGVTGCKQSDSGRPFQHGTIKGRRQTVWKKPWVCWTCVEGGHRSVAWLVTSQLAYAAPHLSGMSEVPSVTPCSAERDFSSGIPTFSRKHRAGSARMALYRSYPDREEWEMSEVIVRTHKTYLLKGSLAPVRFLTRERSLS